jgi:plasmid maintenance system antidote protein VapI
VAPRTPLYNVNLLVEDMAARGWVAKDVAQAASVSPSSVSLFLNRKIQSPKMADKLARALGYSPRRYLVRRAA